jgi:predicted O-methyltransferase YrrM
MDFVKNKLSKFESLGVSINLFKGDTTKTLPLELGRLPQMDLVFIDGGHSYKTVKSDWECVKRLISKGSVVIFDDYVNEAGVAHMNMGVNRLVDEIDRDRYAISLLSPVDSFRKPWGTLRTRFARLTLR